MSYKPSYAPGEHNVICDICAKKIKSSQARKTWDGLIVCPEDYDEKHPAFSPLPKFPQEGKAVKDARPESTDTFIAALTGAALNWDEITTYWNFWSTDWDDEILLRQIQYSVASNGDSRTTGTAGGGDL